MGVGKGWASQSTGSRQVLEQVQRQPVQDFHFTGTSRRPRLSLPNINIFKQANPFMEIAALQTAGAVADPPSREGQRRAEGNVHIITPMTPNSLKVSQHEAALPQSLFGSRLASSATVVPGGNNQGSDLSFPLGCVLLINVPARVAPPPPRLFYAADIFTLLIGIERASK